MQERNGGEFTSLRPIDGSFLLNCTRERVHPTDEALELACAGRYPIGSIEMRAFSALTRHAIDARGNETPPGDYALGYLDLFYVGRSDADVNRSLRDWVGTPSQYSRFAPSTHTTCGLRQHGPLPLGNPTLDRVGSSVESSYTHFAFGCSSSTRGAFDKECRNDHAFGGTHGLDNGSHPLSPPGSLRRRPVDDQ